jgi:hypothetical protein
VYESVKEVERKPLIEPSPRAAREREHDRDRDRDRDRVWDKDKDKPLKDKDTQLYTGTSSLPKQDGSEHVKKTPSPK